MDCFLSSFSCNADLDGLREAGSRCKQLADETSVLCDVARAKGDTVKSFTQDMKHSLEVFAGDIDASTFTDIKALIQDNKARQTIAVATEMDDIAFDMAMKSKEMTKAMTQGIESLPDPVREELEAEDTGAGDDEVAAKQLSDVDNDIEELDTCTKSLNRMSVFTAATSGKDAFSGLASKEKVCQILFEKIKEVSSSVARLSQALNGNCCAMLTSGNEMFKCLRLSKLMSKAANAAHRLIMAIINFIKTAWNKIEGFTEEFVTVKNPPSFVKSKAQNVASSVMGSLLRA